MQPLPFKYKIKRGKCVIESNSTNTTIDLRTDDIIGDINGYNIANLEMWTHLLSGLGPTNNSVTLSIFRPTYSINILIPGKTTRQLDGVKETHTISQIKQMICDLGIVDLYIDMFELSFKRCNLSNDSTIGELDIRKGATFVLKYDNM